MELDHDDGSSVRVAVRVRPLIGREKVERCDECVSVVEDEMQIVMGKNRVFTYDYVFSKHAQQSDIWSCVEPQVKATFDGYNSTIFAYGQTGSGKTFTMGSGSSVHIAPEDYGIIPRVISHMFNQVDVKTLEKPQYRAELRVRFLEVYGEEIRDLLVQLVSESGGNDSKVTLREGEGGEVQVTGAVEELVEDADQCMRLLERGTLCRTTGSTLMNAHSSRSHAIFTVSMIQHIPMDGVGDRELTDDDFETRTSYFNFVDLAGSERQKRTQAEGKRLKEGIDINKGLLALGNVISALGDDKKRGRVHVPYRDSKLTRMLQDSLGGNSRTLMLCCVSPADVNFEETLNALKYANRARNIKNKPVVNRDESSALAVELRRQVQMLQAEVFRLRNPGLSESELNLANVGTNMIGMSTDFDTYGNLRSRAEVAENEVGRLTAELKRNRNQLDHLKEEMIAAQAERDYLRLCVEEAGNNGSGATAPGERENTSNILKDQLRTICDLQEKLREAERERDRAMMNNMNGVLSYGSSSGASSSIPVPPFVEDELKVDTELLERAEKEIEREAEMLKKLQEEAMADGDEAASDAAGTGDGEADEDEDMEDSTGSLALTLEISEEEADRERVFNRRQRHLGDSVQDLTHDISLKEQLVQNIRQAQENYDRLKNFYEQKMAQMAEEVRSAQLDRDRLLEEMHQIEVKIKSGVDQGAGSGRLAKLASDLKEKEAELTSLKKKQNEMNRFMNQKKKNEMQLRVLTSEISNMKRQKVELMKKMQDERKRYEEEANRRHREIMSLKKSQQRDKQRIQQLGSQKEAQERVLKRKMEEINAAKARIKQQQQLQAQARRQNATYGRNRAPTARERDAKWLSDEVRRRAEEQHKLEQLQKERASVMKEMETLYAQRERIQADLQNSIPAQGSIRDVLISPLKAPTFNRRHSGVADRELTPEEEQLIYDLEERIEACQAQLEYKEEKISEIADGSGAIVKIESTQSLPEARTLLKMLFGMAVDVKKQDQLKEQDVAKMQVEVAEMSKLLEQERERSQQLKQSYEEALQKVMGGAPAEAAPTLSTPLNERTRILLSVSEERNAELRQKCEELESIRNHIDRQRQLLHQNLVREQQELAASREQIKYLEAQLANAGVGELDHQRADLSSSHGEHGARPAHYAHQPSGPVSWANEFDDDEDDEDDEEMLEHANYSHEEDYDVEMHDGRSSAASEDVPLRGQRDHVGDLSERTRRAYITNRGGSSHSEEYYHEDGDDHDNRSVHDDAPSSAPGSASIFSRLSNPRNFTGIHKNRANESVSKREVLQNRADKARSRRLRDRSIAKPPPRSTTPTERSASMKFAVKPQAKRASPVMEVLENMKLHQADGEPHSPRSSHDGRRESHSDSGVAPPPAPHSDVYSRLAAQYTASAQSKRQRSAPVSRRSGAKKEESGAHDDTDSRRGDILSQDEYSMDDGEDGDYDPLLGASSSNLVERVHDDYRERLNNRSSSSNKLSSSAGPRY
ncbi:hypothetical protein Poli38472_006723 [Pythium oligandrum]|uniref:Kinesin motor domain-containing protein n=1 Tax=Pythium oligandrum TaxID=41045 RepID=A0A8K1FFE2_PYTOL|nr:hypothetical protein Poli38472_006723 [Pythium oligandrum]|eukprot:TMW56713.1 hypothetical protein Poli38472_006723 [Pythium oligandrum]